MSGDRTDALLELLSQRSAVLEALCEEPLYKPDLVDELDASRSTVDRAVRELTDANLVERRQEGHVATVAGRIARDRLVEFETTVGDLTETEPVLSPLPRDAPITSGAVTGAEATPAAATTPYGPLEPLYDRIESADSYRAVLPVLDDPRHVAVLYDHVITHDRPAELVVSPRLFETLSEQFPRRTARMATHDRFEVLVAEALPQFGVSLIETDGATTVGVVVFTDDGVVHGSLVNDADAAVQWARTRYHTAREDARNETAALTASNGDATVDGTTTLGQSLPVELERAGFVELDRSYFREQPVADPTTAWRAGLSLAEVQTGYAVDRVHDEPRGSATGDATLTASLRSTLDGGDAVVLIGPPGSGKSTVCKRVACQWYRENRGPVLYREHGRGRAFEAVDALLATVEDADGRPLVVVEDAVRPAVNAVFDAVQRIDDGEASFLLDARESEWTDPPDPIETDGLTVETMPTLDDRDIHRLVEQFESTVGETIDVPLERLQSEVREEAAAEGVASSGIALLLHRLANYADPLSTERTSIEEAAANLYDDLVDDDVALSVCVLATALTAAGIELDAGLLYAVADPSEFDAVDRALDRLEGRLLFPRGDGTYRTLHETWAVTFLVNVLETDGPDAAARRFGDAASSLLSLADDPRRCDRIAAHRDQQWGPTAVREDPRGWADEVVEALYAMARERPKLAPLLGDGETHAVRLPEACSTGMAESRWAWLARAFVDGDYYDRALAAVEEGLSRADEQSRLTCRLLGVRAEALTQHFELDDARETARRQRQLAAALEAPDLEADALYQLGNTEFVADDHERASELWSEALPIVEDLGDRETEAALHKEIGRAARAMEEFEKAHEQFEAGLRIAREIGNRHLEAVCLTRIALYAFRHQNWEQSREYTTEALRTFRAVGDRWQAGRCLVNLGHGAHSQGDYPAAREYLEEALDVVQRIDHPGLECHVYIQFGWVELKQGDYDAQREQFETALEIAREIDDGWRRGICHNGLGKAALRVGDTDAARGHFESGIEFARESETHYREIVGLIGLARIDRERGDFDAARQRLDAAADLLREGESEIPRVQAAQARLALARGDLESARRLATAAIEEYTSMDRTHEVARCRHLLGRVAAAEGDHDLAAERFESALSTVEQLGAPQDALRILRSWVESCRENGDQEAADRRRERARAIADDAPEATVEAHGEWIDADSAVDAPDR